MSIRHIIAAALALWLAAPSRAAEPAPETVRGKVFLDANRNGALDPGERGVAGVSITDGIGFVVTAADGSYSITPADDPEIPHKPARVVSLSWPSGKWPTGQWWARLDQIKDAANLDFGLRDDEQTVPFTILHASDPHDLLAGPDSRALREAAERRKDAIAFGVITGDFFPNAPTEQTADREMGGIGAYARRFPVPLFLTIGNHDYLGIYGPNWTRQTPLTGAGGWTKHVGPVRWSFNYADTHIAALDFAYVDGTTLREGISRAAIDWLDKDLSRLKKGTRTFLFMHYPWSRFPEFGQVLQKHKVELVSAGHVHRHIDSVQSGVRLTTVARLSQRYRLIHVKQKGVDLADHATGKPAARPKQP